MDGGGKKEVGMNLIQLKKMLRKWQKTKDLTLATDICAALCDALGVK